MAKFSRHTWWFVTALLTAPLLAWAAGVPNLFAPATPIVSSKVNENFKNLSDRLTLLEAQPKPVHTYVRWGRTTCPTGATVVYAGYAAGAHYTHTGGGASTLCLHETPEWLTYDDANQNGALLYGTEYETKGYGVASLVPLQDRDARCVVCEVPRSAEVLVPGRVSCPAGWTLEYNGYLMANHYTQLKNDWSCVDATPEATGSSADQNGNLWYPTEVECGSLPCQAGGYVQDREVACAVCTK